MNIKNILLNLASLALLLQAGIFLYVLLFVDGTVLKVASVGGIIFFIYYYLRAFAYINLKNKHWNCFL